MDRREFLKLCSVAGLGVASSQLPGTYVDATAASGFDKFVVFVNAGGGWDHTLIGNPKGNQPNSEGKVINEGFSPGEIGQAGNLVYAPTAPEVGQFFQDFQQWMTVINGIDCETNGHQTGQINTWSGRLQQQTPCIASLIAAVHGGVKPLAFITNGGYDSTFGVPVSKTRLGNTDALFPLIYPNAVNPDEGEDANTIFTDETFQRILATRQERLDRMIAEQNLPRLKESMNLLYTSRLGMKELKKIVDYLPDDLGDGMERQANIVMAAWMAGLAQTATMSEGGFDTHGPDTDANQAGNLAQLFNGTRALLNRAADLGVLDKMLVVMGSEFGRTPYYNAQGGKDHWSVGELIIIDPSGQVPGNRLIGATDEFGEYRKLNAATLQVDDDNGIALKNSHIHKWLRRFTGIEQADVVKLFPLRVEEDVDLAQPV